MKQNKEQTEIRPESIHAQLMIAGTLVFLIALFWLPDTIGGTSSIKAATTRIMTGVQVIGCYLGFAGIIFGHKLLSHPRDERSGETELED